MPTLVIPMGETLLETQYTPAEAERTIDSDATQNSKDTTQEFIKQMTERGSAVSNIQGDYVQVLEELEYELESGQVTVTIEGEKIIVEMTEGDTGASGKKSKAKGGVTQETIEIAKKLEDLRTFATSEIVLKRERNWEPRGKEIVNRSSIEEIREALNDEIDEGIAEIEKEGDSVLIRLTKADSFVQVKRDYPGLKIPFSGWKRPVGNERDNKIEGTLTIRWSVLAERLNPILTCLPQEPLQ